MALCHFLAILSTEVLVPATFKNAHAVFDQGRGFERGEGKIVYGYLAKPGQVGYCRCHVTVHVYVSCSFIMVSPCIKGENFLILS